MAKKPNYRFEKRQKELSRKARKDEKLQRRKADEDPDAPETGDEVLEDEDDAADEGEANADPDPA